MPALGSTFNIVATFRDSGSDLVDPDNIAVDVLDENGDSITGATPATAQRISLGKYSFAWTPDAEGSFTVVITGELTSDPDIVLTQEFTITADNPDSTAPALDEDVILMFSSGFDPLLVDPELIQSYVPEATLMEIALMVNKFSLEVTKIFTNGDYPSIAYDYIQAATLCALSRLHEGINSSSYSGFTLGDLQVMDTSSSKSGTNRGNVSSWCELAEILRKEMKLAKGGMVSSVKAGSWRSPVPSRRLKKAERPHGRRYL